MVQGTSDYGDGLSDDEQIRRHTLEYEEDENAPLPSKIPGSEQHYALQNLGIPRSSDGNVRILPEGVFSTGAFTGINLSRSRLGYFACRNS
jgi:hypothetical protein